MALSYGSRGGELHSAASAGKDAKIQAPSPLQHKTVGAEAQSSRIHLLQVVFGVWPMGQLARARARVRARAREVIWGRTGEESQALDQALQPVLRFLKV